MNFLLEILSLKDRKPYWGGHQEGLFFCTFDLLRPSYLLEPKSRRVFSSRVTFFGERQSSEDIFSYYEMLSDRLLLLFWVLLTPNVIEGMCEDTPPLFTFPGLEVLMEPASNICW